MNAAEVSTRAANAPAVPAPASPEASPDFKPEYEHYLAQTADLADEQLLVCRADTDQMSANIRAGVAAVCCPEIAARIRRELPSVQLDALRDLPRLGDTVAHAARQTLPAPRPPRLRETLARARHVRRILLAQLELLVLTGIIGRQEYAPLRKGKGAVSLATDLIDAAALFARHAPEIEGKLAIQPALIAEGRELGFRLRERITPGSGVKSHLEIKSATALRRDRLWTLLVRRYQDLRRVAGWLWLGEADGRVPALMAQPRKPRRHQKPGRGVVPTAPGADRSAGESTARPSPPRSPPEPVEERAAASSEVVRDALPGASLRLVRGQLPGCRSGIDGARRRPATAHQPGNKSTAAPAGTATVIKGGRPLGQAVGRNSDGPSVVRPEVGLADLPTSGRDPTPRSSRRRSPPATSAG